MKKLILCAAALGLTACTAAAHDRDRYAAPPPPPANYQNNGYPGAPGANVYYRPVTNYYGPVTINNAPTPDAGPVPYPYANAAPAYPDNYGSYDGSYSYGAAYGGYGQGYGYPTAPYPYSAGAGMQPPVYDRAREDPWNGYNWGWNNGY